MIAALRLKSRKAACSGETFRLSPLPEASSRWEMAVAALPGASLYHRSRWLELLARTHGLHFWLAEVERDGLSASAAILARSKRPFSRRLVALPFSDFCPPLAADERALEALTHGLRQTAAARGGLEIRGLDAPAPWKTVRCFENWTLDLRRPLRSLEQALLRGFRTHLHRGTRLGIRIDRGRSADLIERFYTMQLRTRKRLGLPAQPLRFFRLAQELFGPTEDFEVWIASYAGRDAASIVILRDGDEIHDKWGARAIDAPVGANHLLTWTLVEEFVGRATRFHLGRADVRNKGLTTFKREIGGRPEPLPYAFYPKAYEVSSEVTSGARRALTAIWRHLPLGVARILGGAIYGYLA